LTWTAAEVRNMRRNIAYHQRRPPRTVAASEAIAVMDEQQRRFASFGMPWGPGSGWLLGALGEPHIDAYHPCERKD
jgi:hypothetical protein